MKSVVWIVVLVAIVGGLAYPKIKPLLAQGGAGEKAGAAKPGGPGGARSSGGPLKVATFEVVPTVFAESITSTGTVRADEGVELQAETNGKVVSINFTEGSPVKQGDLLVKLNDSDLRANMDRYQYSRQLAEVRYNRISKLLKQGVVTQDDYDSALNEMNVQQSFIDLYKAEVAKTEIRAPFDGVVGLRYVSVGAYVTANTKIATLQRLDELKIDFSVPEKYSGRIKVGNPVSFTVAGGFNRYEGRIYAMDPRIDSATRTLLVRALYPNRDGSLLPGAFTNVLTQLERMPEAVLIPSEAVIPGLTEKNVFVIKDGVAERRAVETGSRTESLVHIISGLQPGDQVITSGLQQMRAGLPVESLGGPKRDTQEIGTKDTGAETQKPTPGVTAFAPVAVSRWTAL
jgi:membrane fusion protein (multidrug efflux system)